MQSFSLILLASIVNAQTTAAATTSATMAANATSAYPTGATVAPAARNTMLPPAVPQSGAISGRTTALLSIVGLVLFAL